MKVIVIHNTSFNESWTDYNVVNQIPHVSPCASLELGARSHQDSSEAAQAVTLGFKGIIEEMMIE